MDAGTADPNSVIPGVTWFWGYSDGSQYDGYAGTLQFHITHDINRSGSVEDLYTANATSRASPPVPPIDVDKGVAGSGVDLQLTYQRDRRGRAGYDMVFGFTALKLDDTDLSAAQVFDHVDVMQYTATDTHTFTDTFNVRDTYTYDTAGMVPPGAPYAGTYAGPGPLLDNVPESQGRNYLDVTRESSSVRRVSDPVVVDSYELNASVQAEAEGMLFDLRAGPRFSFGTNSLSCAIIPHVSVGYVDLDIERTERQVAHYAGGNSALLSRTVESEETGEWTYGAGLLAMCDYAMGNWFITVAGGYEWVGEKVEVQIGPNRVTLDASGWTAKLGLGRIL